MVLEGMDECKEFASPEGVLTADVNVCYDDQKTAEVAGEQADGSKRTARSGAKREPLAALPPPRRQPNGRGHGTKIFTTPDSHLL